MSKYQKSLDKIKRDVEYIVEKQMCDYIDNTFESSLDEVNILQQAIDITNGVKNFILELEKAQKVYWDKKHKSTYEDTKNFYRGMEHSVLACINDLKNIVGDKNE